MVMVRSRAEKAITHWGLKPAKRLLPLYLYLAGIQLRARSLSMPWRILLKSYSQTQPVCVSFQLYLYLGAYFIKNFHTDQIFFLTYIILNKCYYIYTSMYHFNICGIQK